ncbi:hypothetical protein KTE50_31175, partial [Burkholderia multivorans]|uniref:hypothetical protein n=1 Tax=Burkholderia multivorans TaxID=87883 RepID=UPI001C26A9C7
MLSVEAIVMRLLSCRLLLSRQSGTARIAALYRHVSRLRAARDGMRRRAAAPRTRSRGRKDVNFVTVCRPPGHGKGRRIGRRALPPPCAQPPPHGAHAAIAA